MPVKGLPALREAVSDYYRRNQGLNYSSDDILIGPGSKELMFLLQFVYYGDLLIPTPSWVSYAPQANIIGRHVRWITTSSEHNWKITPSSIEKLCKDDPLKPRVLIFNYPSNPTGVSYSADELKAIAEAAEKYKIILLSDEIYGALHHEGKHVSIAKYYPEGTIISGGLSKWCGAGGWRLGTFAYPKNLRWLLDSMAVVASETFTSTSTPIQYAAIRAFKGGIRIEKYLWNCRYILSALGNKITQMLVDAGVHVAKPDGGFYIFPDFSPLREVLLNKEIITNTELCTKLLEDTGVAALPGSAFGRPENELTMRIAYVDFDGTRAISAAVEMNSQQKIDDEFLEIYCGNVLKAIQLICDWLKS